MNTNGAAGTSMPPSSAWAWKFRPTANDFCGRTTGGPRVASDTRPVGVFAASSLVSDASRAGWAMAFIGSALSDPELTSCRSK